MGRQIDEDVLLKNLEWLEDYDHYVLHDVKISIDETPTVKAIPIDWIEKFMDRFRLDMVTGDEFALLHYMLTEWEIENEKDI